MKKKSIKKKPFSNEFNIEEILKKEITNVRCKERNKPNMDLMAKAFYDLIKQLK